MLCSLCGDIILTKKGALLDEDGKALCPHQPGGESLQNSAREGCHICSALWNRLTSSPKTYLLELDINDLITIVTIGMPQTFEVLTNIFAPETLVLCVQFEVDIAIWDWPRP